MPQLAPSVAEVESSLQPLLRADASTFVPMERAMAPCEGATPCPVSTDPFTTERELRAAALKAPTTSALIVCPTVPVWCEVPTFRYVVICVGQRDRLDPDEGTSLRTVPRDLEDMSSVSAGSVDHDCRECDSSHCSADDAGDQRLRKEQAGQRGTVESSPSPQVTGVSQSSKVDNPQSL